MRQNAPRRPGGVSRAATACYILFAALLLYAAARFSGRVAARELRPDASCSAAMAEAAVTPDETCPFVTSVLPVVHLSSSILLFSTCTHTAGSAQTPGFVRVFLFLKGFVDISLLALF